MSTRSSKQHEPHRVPENTETGVLLGREFITAVVVFHESVGRLLGLTAVAVLAELVAWRRRGIGVPAAPAPAVAVDPVCGMEVASGSGTPAAEHEGRVSSFCCTGCRERFGPTARAPCVKMS